MRKITFFFGLMLLFTVSLSANAAAGDNVQIENGQYIIKNSANNDYCATNGDYVIRLGSQPTASTAADYLFTFTYNAEKQAYTIQDKDGKYINYSNPNDKGNSITLTADATTENSYYWRIVENYGSGIGYDIISLTLDNAAGSQAWNFSGNHNGSNKRLGTWDANDNNSVWTIEKFEIDETLIERNSWTITASSACDEGSAGGQIGTAIDGNPNTYWHSSWGGSNSYGVGNTMPQWFIIDLGEEQTFNVFGYTPRRDLGNGTCESYKLYVQSEPFAADFSRSEGCTADIQAQVAALTGEVASGDLAFANNSEKKVVLPNMVTGRYVMFVFTAGKSNFATCAEFNLYKDENAVPEDPVAVLAAAKVELQALIESVGGGYGFEIETDVDQIIWPGEYNFSVAKEELFTSAQTALEGDNLSAVYAAIRDISLYKSLCSSTGAPTSVIYTFGAEYGTILLPGNIAVPSGVKAYTCNGIDNNGILQLSPLTTGFIENTPYIVQGTPGKKYQLIGYNHQKANAQTITTGVLTGVYEATQAPVGSYVLQIQDNKLGFYKVGESVQPTVGANRCYVTLPQNTAANVRALFFDAAVTGIDAAPATPADDAPAYDLSGRRIHKMGKGIYIIGGKKVIVK